MQALPHPLVAAGATRPPKKMVAARSAKTVIKNGPKAAAGARGFANPAGLGLLVNLVNGVFERQLHIARPLQVRKGPGMLHDQLEILPRIEPYANSPRVRHLLHRGMHPLAPALNESLIVDQATAFGFISFHAHTVLSPEPRVVTLL